MYDLGTTTRTLCVTPFFVEADSWQTPHIIKFLLSRRDRDVFTTVTSNENVPLRRLIPCISRFSGIRARQEPARARALRPCLRPGEDKRA